MVSSTSVETRLIRASGASSAAAFAEAIKLISLGTGIDKYSSLPDIKPRLKSSSPAKKITPSKKEKNIDE